MSNFDSIRAQAVSALDAFWESDEAPAKPAPKRRAKSKVKRKRRPSAKKVAAKPAPKKKPAAKASAFAGMSDLIDNAMGGA
tara:strand:+ start:1201 stop:1443 length:243 start_codon:yes stop_codon:yes gene_type:complete